MSRSAKSVTVVISGDYQGPQNQSTEASASGVTYASAPEVKVYPRFIVSDQIQEDSRFLLLMNKRLGGEYRIVEEMTSVVEIGSSR